MNCALEKYTQNKAGSAVDLWNRSMPAGFSIDLRLWRQNVDCCDRLLPDASFFAIDLETSRPVGMIIAKNPNHICAAAVLPEYRRKQIGGALVRSSIRAFQEASQPPSKMVTGQDYAHFFPGVPDSFLEARAFFEALGWKRSEGWCADLIRDLRDFEIDSKSASLINKLKGDGFEMRSCGERDVESLYRLVSDNFSARWLFETKQRVETEGDPSEIQIAVYRENVIGFAHTFTTHSKKLGPSIYWRDAMGENYGGLGPIGVSKDFRKIGLGLALLTHSVGEVKRAGTRRMAIDWTVLVDFYGKLGFEVWRRFAPYSLDITPSE